MPWRKSPSARPLRSRAKKSDRRVIRKGRPVSDAGRDADGPRDGESVGSGSTGSPSRPVRSFGRSSTRSSEHPAGRRSSGQSPGQSPDPLFDPFESFDAHDQAAGRAPARPGDPTDSPDSPDSPAEPTYTRSRRTPGEIKPDQDRADKSQRPGRSLKGRALGYLSRREYSRAELSRKLIPFVEEADPLEALLDALESEGWLSDSRFAESLIHRRASRLGANRIVGELKRHALGQTLIEEASAQLRETELARAQAVWRKKYGQLPETPAERARQARFLAARGFSGATISKILKGIDEEWSGE
jgi:regulatory protein